MYKKIEKQGTEGSFKYCANGPIGVSSPMSRHGPDVGVPVWDSSIDRKFA